MNKETTKEKQSEFGKGLVYCLGLFLAHAERIREDLKIYESNRAYEIWFNGAGDHLFEFDAELAPEHLVDRCIAFREKVLMLRSSFRQIATSKDYTWAVQEAKDLLRLIDQAHNIESIKGQYE